MRKRITAICTAACMLAGICTAELPPACREDVTLTAYAYDEVTVGDVVYAVYEDHAEAMYLRSAAASALGLSSDPPTELEFPDEVEGVPVTVIRDNFVRYTMWSSSDESPLEKIKLPAYLKEIKRDAFRECHSLTEITFPDTLETIGDSAFAKCTALKELTLPDTLEALGDSAFSGCTGLTKAILPDSMETIPADLFRGCTALADVTLPKSMSAFSASAFSGTAFLEKYDNDMLIRDNTLYYAGKFSPLTYSGDTPVIPEGVTSIAKGAFELYSHNTVILPSTLTALSDDLKLPLRTLTIPETVRYIGKESLYRYYTKYIVFEGMKCDFSTESILTGGDNSVTFYAPEGSDAQKYAEANGIKWEPLENEPPVSITEDNLSYLLYRDHAELCVNALPDDGTELNAIIIPETVQGKPVTVIAGKWKNGSRNYTDTEVIEINMHSMIHEISIPASVKEIEADAFHFLRGIEKVTVAEGFAPKKAGESAFSSTPWYTAQTESGEPVMLGKVLLDAGACEGEVTVPADVILADGAYADNDNITALILPDSMATIPERAFAGCNDLQSVRLPSSLKKIGKSAFMNCINLNTIAFPASDSIVIGEEAFKSCGFTLLHLPANVTEIRQNAFSNNSRLEHLIFENPDCIIDKDAQKTNWSSDAYKGTIYGAENSTAQAYAELNSYPFKTMDDLPPESGVYDGYIPYTRYKDHVEIRPVDVKGREKVVLPAEIGGLPVTEVGEFYNSDVQPWDFEPEETFSLELPDTVTKLPERGFQQNNCLNSIKLPKNLKSLPDDCFAWCNNLESVELPEDITEIPKWCFVNCEALEEISIPAGVTKIGGQAFAGCRNLKAVNLPDALEIIEEGAFTATDMLTEIHLPANVKEIGAGALATNYLADAGNYKIYLIESENPDRYDSETRLSAITVDAQNPYFTAKDGVLYNKDMTEIIAVPDGKTGVFTIPDTVKTIKSMSIYGCTSITEVVIPESVEEIEEYGLNRTGIETLTIPASLKKIGVNAFAENVKLKTIQFPESMTEIPDGAFNSARALESVVIPETITTIGAGAFSGCFSLKDVTIPKSVTKIKPQAFGAEASYGEPGTLVPWLKGRTVVVNGFLLNIVIPQDGVLVIPDGVTDIGGVSVVNNQKITSIEFPESIKSISSFTDLPKLTSVIIRSDDCEITDGAFGSPMGWDPNTNQTFYTYNPDCTVYCNADSTAAAYAKEKGFQTAPLPEKVTVPETTTTSTTTTTTSTTTTTTTTSAAQPTTTTVTTTTTTAAVSTTADTTTSASVTGTTETQESVTTATTETAPPAVEDSRGDINADGEISVADAQLALNAYVKRMAGSETGLTAEQAQATDVNRDKEISVDDAQTILMYYVKNSLSHTPTSWEDLLEKKQPAKLPKAIKRK